MRAAYLAVLATVFVISPMSAAISNAAPHWETNLKAAQEQASRSQKLVLVHCWTPSCGPCRAMEQTVFADPNVTHTLSQHYVPVKLNLQDDPEFGRKYGIKTIPTDVVITADGGLVELTNSPRTAETYIAKFTQVALSSATQPVSTSVPMTEIAQNARGAMASPPTAVQPMTGVPTATNGGLVGDRYKDHPLVNGFADRYGQEAGPGIPDYRSGDVGDSRYGQPPAQPSPVVQPSQPAQQPLANPAAINQAPAAASGFGGSMTAPAHREPAMQSPGAPAAVNPNPHNIQLPAGVPPLAFDGYCTVTVRNQEAWQLGNPAWGVIHRGQTYLFSSQQAQQEFRSKPDFYGLELGGHDVVLYLETGQLAHGSREFGATYQAGGVFLFVNEANLKKFQADPTRFISQLQQMRSNAPAQPQR